MIDIDNNRCETEACSVYDRYDRQRSRYSISGQRICIDCCKSLYPDIAKRGLQMRSELLIIAEVERLVPQLQTAFDVLWDCPASCSTRLKPDRVWFFQIADKIVTIHLEVDEIGNRHEDSDDRVVVIHNNLQSEHSWLVRFNPGPSSDGRPACVVRKQLANGDRRYERAPGPEWEHRMSVLSAHIANIYSSVQRGEEPKESNWKSKLFF
jgi:hypothetical protein